MANLECLIKRYPSGELQRLIFIDNLDGTFTLTTADSPETYPSQASSIAAGSGIIVAGVTGLSISGTAGRIAKFTGTTSLGNSQIVDAAPNITATLAATGNFIVTGGTQSDGPGGGSGEITLTGGTGLGAGGANVTLIGGTAAGANAGGTVALQSGAAAASAGSSSGTITIVTAAGSATGSGGAAGTIALTGGNAGGDGTVARTGGAITLTSGNSVGAQAGAGITLTGGTGGANAAGTGGPIILTGGTAGAAAGAAGGSISLLASAGSATGSGGAGGAISLLASNAGGDASVNRAGGTVTITAGNSLGATQAGAAVTITAGSAGTANANGGAINLAPGSGAGTGSEGLVNITKGILNVPSTVTAGGTTGNQTINKMSGTVNFAAGASSLTVTNSFVTANSIVLCVVRTNDATALLKNVVPTAGSFVIRLNAVTTAETSVGFVVFNQ